MAQTRNRARRHLNRIVGAPPQRTVPVAQNRFYRPRQWSLNWPSIPSPIGLAVQSPVGRSEEIVRHLLVRYLRDESAATAIEYGLIAAGIALAIIASVKGVGTKLTNTFTSVSTAL